MTGLFLESEAAIVAAAAAAACFSARRGSVGERLGFGERESSPEGMIGETMNWGPVACEEVGLGTGRVLLSLSVAAVVVVVVAVVVVSVVCFWSLVGLPRPWKIEKKRRRERKRKRKMEKRGKTKDIWRENREYVESETTCELIDLENGERTVKATRRAVEMRTRNDT